MRRPAGFYNQGQPATGPWPKSKVFEPREKGFIVNTKSKALNVLEGLFPNPAKSALAGTGNNLTGAAKASGELRQSSR